MRDADVPGVVAELGLPGIVDVHTHFMAPQIMDKVWAYFDAAGPLLGREWPITYRWSDDERVAHLRSMGVTTFSALSYAHRPGVAGFMNDWTLAFAARTSGALSSATFYPEPEAAAYVPQLIVDGVEVFKVHVQVGDFAPNDPLLEPVWGALAESGTPIVLHAGSGPAPGHHTGPAGGERRCKNTRAASPGTIATSIGKSLGPAVMKAACNVDSGNMDLQTSWGRGSGDATVSRALDDRGARADHLAEPRWQRR